VILLLLGKLKRQPATSQLRLILEGKIKSLRSHYTEIVQQDLFFICECLMEEIIVEPDLAEMVVDRLEQIIKHSLFSSQRQQAINFLCTLTQTRLYGSVARKEIIKLVTQDNLQDLDLRKEFARRFYQIPTITPEEKQQIGQALLRLAQQPDLSIQQSVDILRLLYLESPLESEERKQSAQRLLTLLQRPGPLDWQVVGIAGDFYEKSPPESEERQQVTQLLLNMMRNTNLSIDERLQRASMFYKRNRRSSSLSPINSNKHAQVSRMLLDWLHEPQLSFEENFAIAQFLYQISTTSSEELHQAIQILSTIAQQASLSHDQILQIAEALYNDPSDKSEGKQEANRILFNLAQQPHLPFEVKLQIIKTIGRENSPNSEEWRQADQMLLSLIQEPRLSVEQILHIDRLFSQYRFSGESEAWPQLIQPLFDVLYQQELSIDSSLAISRILYWEAARQSEEREKLVQMLLSLTKRPDATTEDILKIAGLFGHDAPIEDQERGVGLLFELSQRNDLSLEQKVSVAHDLYFSSSLHVTYRQAAITMISELLSTPELPFNLEYKILQTYYGYQDVEEQISIRQRLWQLVEGQNIAIDQKLEVVSIPLYSREASCAEIIKSIQIAIRLLGIDMVKQYISSWGG